VVALWPCRELDAVTLSAAFGHLAKLHKMAGEESAVPQQLR
jgi:hypothetical protein